MVDIDASWQKKKTLVYTFYRMVNIVYLVCNLKINGYNKNMVVFGAFTYVISNYLG